MNARQLLATFRTVLVRPRRWRAALRQAVLLRPDRWWSRPPFLPLPDREWLRFRSVTAYGDPTAPFAAADLDVWLAWTDTVRPAPIPAPEAISRPGRLRSAG